MLQLTGRQKAYLDDLEDPAEVAEWMEQRLAAGETRLTIKNGRQLTFSGDYIAAALRYLKSKTF